MSPRQHVVKIMNVVTFTHAPPQTCTFYYDFFSCLSHCEVCVVGHDAWPRCSWGPAPDYFACCADLAVEGLDATYQAWGLSNSWNHVEAQIWRTRRSGILRKKAAYSLVVVQSPSHFHPRQIASSVRSRMERLRLWMRVPVCVWSVPHRQVSVNWSMCFKVW